MRAVVRLDRPARGGSGSCDKEDEECNDDEECNNDNDDNNNDDDDTRKQAAKSRGVDPLGNACTNMVVVLLLSLLSLLSLLLSMLSRIVGSLGSRGGEVVSPVFGTDIAGSCGTVHTRTVPGAHLSISG